MDRELTSADRTEEKYYPCLYQAAANSSENKNRKRVRTAFTSQQLWVLENEFLSSCYITKTRRVQLASILRLDDRQIKIWFQNRRMKRKRETGGSLSPCSSPSLLNPSPPVLPAPMPTFSDSHRSTNAAGYNPAEVKPTNPACLSRAPFYPKWYHAQNSTSCCYRPNDTPVYQNQENQRSEEVPYASHCSNNLLPQCQFASRSSVCTKEDFQQVDFKLQISVPQTKNFHSPIEQEQHKSSCMFSNYYSESDAVQCTEEFEYDSSNSTNVPPFCRTMPPPLKHMNEL